MGRRSYSGRRSDEAWLVESQCMIGPCRAAMTERTRSSARPSSTRARAPRRRHRLARPAQGGRAPRHRGGVLRRRRQPARPGARVLRALAARPRAHRGHRRRRRPRHAGRDRRAHRGGRRRRWPPAHSPSARADQSPRGAAAQPRRRPFFIAPHPPLPADRARFVGERGGHGRRGDARRRPRDGAERVVGGRGSRCRWSPRPRAALAAERPPSVDEHPSNVCVDSGPATRPPPTPPSRAPPTSSGWRRGSIG